MHLEYKKLVPSAQPPERNKIADAGWDLRSLEYHSLSPGQQVSVHTGLAIQLSPDPDSPDEQKLYSPDTGLFTYYLRIAGKSGLADKHGIHIAGGVVDRGYTGEIVVILANLGFYMNGQLVSRPFEVNIGDKIAQLVPTIIPRITHSLIVDEFPVTERGDAGFGSSGV